MEYSLDEGIGSENNNHSITLKDNSARATWTIWSIALVGSVSAASFIASFLFMEFSSHDTFSSQNLYNDWFEGIDFLYSIFSITAAISFFCWFRRAYSNIQGLGMTTEHTDGWAIGFFFIPFICWVKPFSLMDEVIKAHWQSLHSISEPSDYDTRKSAMLVWWILFLLTNSFQGLISMGLRLAIESGYYSNLISLTATTLIEVAAVVAAIHFIRKVSKDEKLLYQHSIGEPAFSYEKYI